MSCVVLCLMSCVVPLVMPWVCALCRVLRLELRLFVLSSALYCVLVSSEVASGVSCLVLSFVIMSSLVSLSRGGACLEFVVSFSCV